MQIVHYPHPALRWKSKPVIEIGGELRATVRTMFDLMYEAKGIGLAANQVDLPYCLFIANATGDPEQTDEEYIFVNPEIVRRKGSEEGEEGCLSLPELYGQVRRAEEIVVEAFDLKGRGFTMELTELPARVVQHECDHLDGVLFPDRMTESDRHEIQQNLDDFETLYHERQKIGEIPSDETIRKRLKGLEPS